MRLYAGILRSMALYGAPIWADSLTRRENAANLRRPQRAIAQRVARCYRTVAHAAACALAGTPPWEMEARVLAGLYSWQQDQRARGDQIAPREQVALRRSLQETLVQSWARDLAAAPAGRWTLDALGPVLKSWLERRSGFLSFRLVQVLTGHGCFRGYLHRIGREESPSCLDCGAAEDTAGHTLFECPAWAPQRSELTAAAGQIASLPEVIKAMLRSEAAWAATASFCEQVMSLKEAAEREREDDPSAPLLRRRRRGRTRRQYDRLVPPGGDLRVMGVGAPTPALQGSSPPPDGGGGAPLATPVSPPPPSGGG